MHVRDAFPVFALALSCATAPIGRGGPVYEVRVASVNGSPVSLRGPVGHPACVLQVGDRVARVWLAQPSQTNPEGPLVLEAEARSLEEGILVERSWGEAVVHKVTATELAAGGAVVYVPSSSKPTTVELRFQPRRPVRSDPKDDLSKRRTGFEEHVTGRRLR